MYMFLPLFVENCLRICQRPNGSGYVSDSTVTGVGASDTEGSELCHDTLQLEECIFALLASGCLLVSRQAHGYEWC